MGNIKNVDVLVFFWGGLGLGWFGDLYVISIFGDLDVGGLWSILIIDGLRFDDGRY